MNFEYKFPPATRYENNFAKSKLISKTRLNTKLQAVLEHDVKDVIWAHKLSPETTNISACKQVQEIQVFVFKVNNHSINFKLLKSIDKAIPSPLLFRFEIGIEVRYAMAYKRVSKSQVHHYVVGPYFVSPWMISGHIDVRPLPMVLDLSLLYRAFLSDLSQAPVREGEALDDFATRAQSLQSKQRHVQRLEQQYRNQDHNRLQRGLIRDQQARLRREIDELK